MSASTHDGQSFVGKVALVTGSGSGLGFAIARALGEAGAKVAAHYRSNRSGVEQLQQHLEAAGGQCAMLQADLGKSQDVERMFRELDAAFGGRIDMLVNNAGEWMDKSPIAQCTESQWDRMLTINAKSVFLCCQQAARRMMVQGEGAIVNIGSVAGHTGGGGGTVPYAAAKAAVHTFTRGLAKELAPHGIRVNAVSPGLFDTAMIEGRVSDEAGKAFKGMTPLGRYGQPPEIAPVVMMLLGSGASYMTGEIVEGNGGLLMR